MVSVTVPLSLLPSPWFTGMPILTELDDSAVEYEADSLRRPLMILAGLTLFVIAILALHRQFTAIDYTQLVGAMRAVQGSPLVIALLLTACGYTFVCGYDLLALSYLDRHLPPRQTLITSFISYAFSNSIGMSMLGGSVVRYRLYSAWGLTGFEISRVIGFCYLTFWLGFLALGGATFVIDPLVLPPATRLPFETVRPIGLLMLAGLGGIVIWMLRREKPLRLYRWEIHTPRATIIGGQILVASLELLCAAGVLYALLYRVIPLSYGQFLAIFLLALIIGLISHVPGGLGVFEMIMVAALPRVPPAQLLGALIVYRLVYYLLPLTLAALALAVLEWERADKRVRRTAGLLGDAVQGLTPSVFAAAISLTGLVLLISGVLPAAPARLQLLDRFLPVAVIEGSHLLSAVVGVLLLVLGRSLHRRLDAAWLSAIVLLAMGSLLSLMRDGGYEQAILLALVLVALLPCRDAFYRRSPLLEEQFSLTWLLMITAAIGSTIWLGLYAYRSIDYTSQIWWVFGLDAHAPRFLRATAIAAITLLVYTTVRLMQASSPPLDPANGRLLADAHPIVKANDRAAANLVFLGDKSLIFSDDNRTFLMYAISGRSWIAMGDPVGPVKEWPDLLWHFREFCEEYQGRTIFYQVHPEMIDLYLDMGLTSMKIGEEARLSLKDFTLDGPGRRDLRQIAAGMEREGVSVSIVPPEGQRLVMPHLKRISDNWCRDRNATEKGFSLGWFSPEYISRFHLATVRHERRIVAFAAIWQAAPGTEMAIDFLRYDDHAPDGIMEYLFIQLMLWGKVQGYSWFNLGMAPLADLDQDALAPLWNRLGNLVYRHGEHFYNFQSLRQFKEKFAPTWEPRYLVFPRDFALPIVLSDLTRLISGGATATPPTHR